MLVLSNLQLGPTLTAHWYADSSSEVTMQPQPTEKEIQFILDAIAEYLTVKVSSGCKSSMHQSCKWTTCADLEDTQHKKTARTLTFWFVLLLSGLSFCKNVTCVNRVQTNRVQHCCDKIPSTCIIHVSHAQNPGQIAWAAGHHEMHVQVSKCITKSRWISLH